jgi:hypothetical protein
MPRPLEFAVKQLVKLPRSLCETVMPGMRIPNNASNVQLARIDHVHLEHFDWEKSNEFIKNFMFVEAYRVISKIHYRGYRRGPFVYVASQSRGRVSRSSVCGCVASREVRQHYHWVL